MPTFFSKDTISTSKASTTRNRLTEAPLAVHGSSPPAVCSLSDESLSALKGLTNLETLSLRGGIHVKGFGLGSIKDMDKLSRLDLGHTDLFSDALKHVAGKSTLQELLLDHTRLSDAGLHYLRELDNLKTLDLSHTRITDKGMTHISGLKNLQNLNLSNNTLTNDALAALKDLPQLRYLNLGSSAIDDAGVADHLVGMRSLRHLYLQDTLVTDKVMEKLKGMNLIGLHLGNTDVTDSGLKNIAKIAGLETLNLIDTRVSNAGLRELLPLKNLKSLNLARLGDRETITNDAIATLKQMGSLEQLNLMGTGITRDGVKELQRALPNCKILSNAY